MTTRVPQADPGRAATWLVTAGLSALIAVAAVATPQGYDVTTYHVGDGLPSDEVYSLTQDGLGRLWFATRSGLVVFDGVHWTEALGFPLDRSAQVRFDGRDTVWLSTTHPALAVLAFAADRWREVPQVQRLDLPAVEATSLGPPRVTALAVARPDDQPEIALVLGRSLLLVHRGGVWHRFDDDSGLPLGGVQAVAHSGGRLFVATKTFVATLDGDRIEPLGWPEEDTVHGPIKALAVRPGPGGDNDPEVWILGRDRVVRATREGATTVADGFRLGAAGPRPAVITPTRDGCFFFGHSHRLLHAHPGGRPELLDQASGFATTGAYDLIEDREGHLWVASHRGVSKLESMTFASFTARHGLLEDEVTAAVQRRDGTVVFGHNHGLTLLGESGFETLSFSSPEDFAAAPPRVMDLLVDDHDRVWIAASDLGLGRLSVDGDLRWYDWRGTRPGDSVVALLDRGDGSLLVGCDSGLVPFDPALDHLPSPTVTVRGVRRLARCRDGTLLAATNGSGLVRVDSDGVVSVVGSDDGPRYAFTVLEDRRGRVWVGASSGLFEARDGLLVRPDGVAEITAPVYLIVEDDDGSLWVGTNDGVFHWRGDELRRYTAENGLAGRETNRDGGLVDAQGRLWIGTESGLSLYRRDHDPGPPPAPTVAHTGVEVAGLGWVEPAEALDADHNNLTFHFAAVSFHHEDRLRYRCRLNGFDADWGPPMAAHQRSVRYTNLPPGTYRLAVEAGAGAGPWSPPVLSPAITIRQPFWWTWWFPPLMIATSVLVVVTTTRAGMRWRAAAVLEERVRQRTAELEEVNRALHQEMEARRRAEESSLQAQKMESLGRLAGGVAHDFNNLLAVILGSAELALDQLPGDHPARPDLDEILHNSERAAALTQQLLAVARRQVIEPRTLDLNHLVVGLDRMLRRLLTENIELITIPGRDLRPVQADLAQLEQVVLNLVVNARDAMPDGGRLTIHTRNRVLEPGTSSRYRGAAPGEWVELTVSDTGSGIDSDVLGHLFEPFFTTKERGRGTGLGLATSFGIITQSGGHIGVDSRPGAGSTFGFILPPATGSAPAPSPMEPTDSARGGTEIILVVEDEPRVRDLVSRVLRSQGYTVITASDGSEALDLADDIDLLVTDVVMPRMGGRRLAQALRAADPGLRVLFISGYAGDDGLATSGLGPRTDFLAKPFSPTTLADRVRRLLDAED